MVWIRSLPGQSRLGAIERDGRDDIQHDEMGEYSCCFVAEAHAGWCLDVGMVRHVHENFVVGSKRVSQDISADSSFERALGGDQRSGESRFQWCKKCMDEGFHLGKSSLVLEVHRCKWRRCVITINPGGFQNLVHVLEE